MLTVFTYTELRTTLTVITISTKELIRFPFTGVIHRSILGKENATETKTST